MSEAEHFVHETAVIDEDVAIGPGTSIWHFSHVMPNAKIGNNCNLGQNVFVDRGVHIGNRVKIQNNVSVYQGVTLEDGVFCGPSMVFTNVDTPRSLHPKDSSEYIETHVGKGATIGANATIVCGNDLGKFCFIGAGSVVTEPVPQYALMVGNPARQSGWACECDQLKKQVDGFEDWKCQKCGREYLLEGSKLKRKEVKK